jgi:malonate transporter and related proteins
MVAVIAALVPVFLLIASGVLVRRSLVTEDVHWIGIERLVYFLLFPALLIGTLAQADFSRVPVAAVGGALLIAVLLMGGFCLALRPLLTRHLGLDGPAFTSLFQGATRWQTFVALAVAGNLYGELGLALASVAAIAMIPLLNVMSVWVLAHFAAPKRPAWRDVALTLARNPLIWSCIVGIVLNVARVPLPAPVHAFADALGRASIALGLLLVGAGLTIKGLIRPAPATLVASVLKLVAMPAVAITAGVLLGAHGPYLAVVACCAAVPTASSAYVLARQMGGDTALMAQILVVETVAAMVTMPIAIELAAAR